MILRSHDSHMIDVGEFSDEFEVLGTVDISVSHELKVVFIDLVLDDSRHRVVKEVSPLSLLDQSL